MMGRIGVIVLGIILSWEAFGSAVLVKSFVCGTDRGITSSGVAVKFRGKNYVVTSSWGVLEESTGICHEALDAATSKSHVAQLAAVDWAAGFALLETPDFVSGPDLESFTSPLPSSGQLEIQGVSKAGVEQIKKARIVASKSSRHHLPSLPYSYEVISDRLDPSFVGAPVTGTSLDGIVSSQWIEIVAGTRARIHEWKTQGSESANHLIVIPLSLIRERLVVGIPARETFQSAASKLSDRGQLYLGKFRWDLSCPEGAGEPPPDGIGPIGGADGVGVGGGMKGVPSCTLRVKRQTEFSLATPKEFPAALGLQLETSLAEGELAIPFLDARNAGGNHTRIPFLTIPHFFTELVKGKRSWVLVRENAPPPTGTAPYDKLMQESARYKKLLLETYPLIAKREDDRDDYRFLYTHAVILGSLNWKLVRWSDYMSLITHVSPDNFAKGIVWEGRPLRLLLKESAEEMENLYLATGGNQ